MKNKQKKTNVPAVVLALVTAGLAFLPAYQALAWGPERETFNWETAASYRTMNSIIDNPSFGDERNFVRIRKVGDAKFVDVVTVSAGEKYEVEIFFHNNASISLNDSGKGIANNVRVNTILPEYVAKGATAEVSGTITSSNTKPSAVWDEASVKATSDVYLRYVAGTAKIHSNGTINGQNVGPDYLFSAEGALIGYSKDHWGILPGCSEYAGYVSYQFVADQPRFEIAKEVSRDVKNDWKETLTASPNEKLDFKITYKNTGTTEQNNVIVKDGLPEKLKYLQGTTLLTNGSSPDGKFVVDDLFTNGLNIGRYQPGSLATLTYKVQMPGADDLSCGDNKFVNGVSIATANGTMKDDVEINVVKDCEGASELPKSGPAEIAIAMVALLGVGVGGAYWYRSRKALMQVQDSINGDSSSEPLDKE